ncbi:Maf family protein, partial [Curtobacterium sp. CT11-133]|uniref:Maf family protein n=1 Tax=Curtobacterium sp. CT11-133 TaxID=3243014 RepID=UPI0039AFA002
MRLYLASTSPARRALLAQTGIEPVLVAPGVDEDAAVAAAAASLGRDLTGPELVAMLAVAKASAVADAPVDGSPADGFVFGGDSAFEGDGVLYGKPHDPEVARERWRQMLAAGGGTLWSGHCVVDRRRVADAPDALDALDVLDAPDPGPGGAGRAGTVPPVRTVDASGGGPLGAAAFVAGVAPGGSAMGGPRGPGGGGGPGGGAGPGGAPGGGERGGGAGGGGGGGPPARGVGGPPAPP